MIFKNNNEIRYTYDASGRKIKVQYLSALGSGFFSIADHEADKPTLVALQSESEVFYCGEWILGKDKKERLRLIRELFDGGFQQGGRNHYFVRNHLGSNVALASFNDAGEMTVEQRNSYSAFGLQMLSESDSVSVKTAIQPYKYCGKEFERMNGFDAYDFGARFYDPEIGRFLSIDPLAEKSPNISPYAYCANNPVRFIDPTGMIWEDPQEAERLKRRIDNRIASLNRDIAKNQDKLDKGCLSEKQVRKVEGKISEAKNRISNLNTSKADIDVLGADQNNVYALSSISGGEHKVRQGSDGKVYIETSSDALSIHEITHVRQSLDAGGLKFSTNGELLNAGVSIRGVSNMEVEAYKMQYSYDRSFPGSLGGKGLHGIDVHSVGGIINDGKYIYPIIYQHSIDLNKFIKQQKKVIEGGK